MHWTYFMTSSPDISSRHPYHMQSQAPHGFFCGVISALTRRNLIKLTTHVQWLWVDHYHYGVLLGFIYNHSLEYMYSSAKFGIEHWLAKLICNFYRMKKGLKSRPFSSFSFPAFYRGPLRGRLFHYHYFRMFLKLIPSDKIKVTSWKFFHR